MVYDYKVKHNGIMYNPGEDVPNGASSKSVQAEAPVEDTKTVRRTVKKADK